MRSFCVAMLLMVTAGLAYGDGSSAIATHQRALKVFDANGKLVGLLSSYSGADGVFLTVNGTTTFVKLSRETGKVGTPSRRFVWSSNSAIAFESADCSGQPLISFDSGWPRPSTQIQQGSDVVVYVGSTVNSEGIQAKSSLQNATCTANASLVQGVRPESSFSVSQRYPEPLTIDY